MDDKDEEFGEERVKHIIQHEVNPSISAKELLDKIVSAARDFSSDCIEDDDITMIVLKAVDEK